MEGIVAFTATIAVLALVTLRAGRLLAPAFLVVPTVFALVSGIDPTEVASRAVSGITDMVPTALTMYALLALFGSLQTYGFLGQVSRWAARKNGGAGLYLHTAVFSLAMGLSGSPAATYTSSISSILPAFHRAGIDPLDLGLVVALSVGISLAWPWSAKTLTLCGVAQADPLQAWLLCLPMQAAGLACLVATCVMLDKRDASKATDVFDGTSKKLDETLPDRIGTMKTVVAAGCILGTAVIAVLGVPFGWAAIWLLSVAIPFGERRESQTHDGTIPARRSLRQRLEHLPERLRPALPAPNASLTALTVGSFSAVAQVMLQNGGASLLQFVPVDVAPWALAFLLAVFGPMLPYQVVYAIVPVLLAMGCEPAQTVAPLMAMFSSTVSPSVPSTALVDASLGTAVLSHPTRNAPKVCLVHVLSLAAGLLFSIACR